MLGTTGLFTAAGILAAAGFLTAAGRSAAACLRSTTALLLLVDAQKLFGFLLNLGLNFVELAGLLTLLIGLSEALESLLRLVLVAGLLSLLYLRDSLREGLGELSCAALSHTLGAHSAGHLLSFTAETGAVHRAAAESLGATAEGLRAAAELRAKLIEVRSV